MKPRQEAAPYMLTAAVSSFRPKRGSSKTGRQRVHRCARPQTLKRTRTQLTRPALEHRQLNGGELRYKLPAPPAHWIYITDGSDRAQLTPGSIDVDYPFGCPPGVVGESNKSKDQSGPQCSYLCPMGFYCPFATSVPTKCSLGKYCPLGSPAPLDCPEGTLGTRRNLTSAAECELCPPGTSCVAGSSFAQPCTVGLHAPSAGSETCTS
eukprot:7383783-Prymnesium_polylepis.1